MADQQARAHAAGAAAAAAEPRDVEVEVNVKFLRRERLSLLCSPTTRVAELKRRVLELHAAAEPSDAAASQDHPEMLRLIYKGKVLKDEQSLDACDFTSGDTLHAVFGRPQTPAAVPTGDASAAATNSSASASAAPPSVPTRPSTFGDSGFSVSIGAQNDEALTAVGDLFSSIFGGIAPPVTVPRSTQPTAPAASYSTASGASAPGTGSTTPAAPPSATPSQSAPPFANIRFVTPPVTQLPPPASVGSSATSLLNQAAILRRSIPALELNPLSQPPGLSAEMYALGNGLREAGDTFLAVHRQLQFVATRFLSENNLNESERQRLRTRVQELVPILEQMGTLSRAVSSNLAASSYGAGVPAPPPPPSPVAQSSQATREPPSTGQTATPAAGVSISPTVNVFTSGGTTHSANISSSIADVFQVVNSALRSGSTGTTAVFPNSSAGAPGSSASSSSPLPPNVQETIGGILNLVSTFTGGGGLGQSGVQTSGPGTGNRSRSAPNVPQETHASSSPLAPASSISSRPLSTLFAQVIRSSITLLSFEGASTASLTIVGDRLCATWTFWTSGTRRLLKICSSACSPTCAIACERSLDPPPTAMYAL